MCAGGLRARKREEGVMEEVEYWWNKDSSFRFEVVGYMEGRGGRIRYTVWLVDGPLYRAHKSIVLHVLEKVTGHGDGQINVYAFGKKIACYEDEFGDRHRQWVARNFVKRIKEEEAALENEWGEMRAMVVRLMRWKCAGLPIENVRAVVRGCREDWLGGAHALGWRKVMLGTKLIERVIVKYC